MKIAPIGGVSIHRIYPISFYQRLEKVPSIEKIDGEIKKYSKQLQDFDLFKFYAQKGIFQSYKKGIYLDYRL